MKSAFVLSLFFFVIASSIASPFAADTIPAWQVTWENTVAAAKKEGRLNFYVGRYGSEPLLNEFRKEFPEIRIFSTNGAGNSLGTRIVAEARAGNVLADLYSGGSVTNFEILYKGKILGSIKSALILPEILDESKWYGGKHSYNDPERQHVFIYLANPTSTSIYFNTHLVNPKEFKSYWDLVNPKWKGKYVSQEPRHGYRSFAAVFLLSSRAWGGFLKKTLHRSAARLRPRSAPDHGLARPRKVCALRRLPRF